MGVCLLTAKSVFDDKHLLQQFKSFCGWAGGSRRVVSFKNVLCSSNRYCELCGAVTTTAMAMLRRARRSACKDEAGFCSEVEKLIAEHHFEVGRMVGRSKIGQAWISVLIERGISFFQPAFGLAAVS